MDSFEKRTHLYRFFVKWEGSKARQKVGGEAKGKGGGCIQNNMEGF